MESSPYVIVVQDDNLPTLGPANPSNLDNNEQNENITNSNSEMESAGDEYTNNIEETENDEMIT